MTAPELVIVSAGHGTPSRTRQLADAIADAALARIGRNAGVVRHTVEVSVLVPHIGPALSRRGLHPPTEAELRRIESAALLIVATPVYKGSYTGHFKHLFDLIDAQALKGKPVALAATGGGERHALVVEHQLRPLFAFFQANALPTAVYAAQNDFDAGGVGSPGLRQRIDDLAAEIAHAATRWPSQPSLAHALAPV